MFFLQTSAGIKRVHGSTSMHPISTSICFTMTILGCMHGWCEHLASSDVIESLDQLHSCFLIRSWIQVGHCLLHDSDHSLGHGKLISHLSPRCKDICFQLFPKQLHINDSITAARLGNRGKLSLCQINVSGTAENNEVFLDKINTISASASLIFLSAPRTYAGLQGQWDLTCFSWALRFDRSTMFSFSAFQSFTA